MRPSIQVLAVVAGGLLLATWSSRAEGQTVAPHRAAASKQFDLRTKARQLRRGRGKADSRERRLEASVSASVIRGRAKPSRSGSDEVAVASAIGGLCLQPAENCQAGDTFNALESTRGIRLTADDFVPMNISVTGLCWRGVYGCDQTTGFTDCQAETSDSFRIRYFADSGGVPGLLLATFTQGVSLTVTGPSLTGGTVADLLPEYEYTATHPELLLEVGERHWVEISNGAGTCGGDGSTCEWFWEISGEGNGRAMQDGTSTSMPNGYAPEDEIIEDMAFCLSVPLAPSVRPPHDSCDTPKAINGEGRFTFDNRTATTDGLPLRDCPPSADTQIENDLWYLWTSSCADTVFVRSCLLTEMDTIIAVYDGSAACPPLEGDLFTCNDDLCGDILEPFQSMVMFSADLDQDYLIRIGRFPGPPRGTGSFEITCGPPPQTACSPGDGDCCDPPIDPVMPTEGCTDENCCRTVCACDPFCCAVFWDAGCQQNGFDDSGCGALALCPQICSVCGEASAGDCCSANGTPNCSDQTCCDMVSNCDQQCAIDWDGSCAINNQRVPGCDAATMCPVLCPECPSKPICETSTVDCCVGVADGNTDVGDGGCEDPTCCNAVCCEDPFCCTVEWDADCAEAGFDDDGARIPSGAGAGVLCTDICPAVCLPGPIRLTDRPIGIVDARQPHSPDNPSQRQGIRELVVSAPIGANDSACWSICETNIEGGVANFVDTVVDNLDGTFTLTFDRIVSINAVTKLTYTAYNETTSSGLIMVHPGNVNGDLITDGADVEALFACLDGSVSCEIWECDMDRNSRCTPADILRLIDLMSGPDYDTWLGTLLPDDAACP